METAVFGDVRVKSNNFPLFKFKKGVSFATSLSLSLSLSTAGGADPVYRETTKAFIFSLQNKEQLGPFKSMVKEPSNAIYNHMYMGPTFGRTDIRINTRAVVDSSSSHLGTSYFAPNEVKDNSTILAGANRFDPDELEVFYLE